jgi:hypothetical protein
MNDIQLLELVADTDAYAPETPVPESVWSRHRCFREIERRVDMRDEVKVVTRPPRDATRPPPEKRSPRALIAAAAFAITIIAVGALALITTLSDDGQETGGSSLDTANQFFAAYNAGDPDSVMALLAPGAVISDYYIAGSTVGDWEMEMVWGTAQGTVVVDPTCSVTADMGLTVVVDCSTETYLAVAQAVSADPVPTHLTMILAEGEIRQLSYAYGYPFFTTVSTPFDAWIWNHRNEDATRVGHGRWETVDEARENGLLTAKYAKEWADYLEANGCSIEDDC